MVHMYIQVQCEVNLNIETYTVLIKYKTDTIILS